MNAGVVLVVDGDDSSRMSIVGALHGLGCQVKVAATGAQARGAVRGTPPDLVILDVDLPDTSGYQICRELRDQFGEGLPIMFLSSTRTEARDEIAGLLLGADVYLPKTVAGELLAAYVRRLLARATPRHRSSSLTPREQQVLELLVAGLRATEIAERLFISPKTTSTHIERVLLKLGAHSQAQAVAFAIRDGVVSATQARGLAKAPA